MKKAAFRLLFSMISVPYGTGDIAEAMISALQMIYASRMKGTDIIEFDAIQHLVLIYST